MLVEINLLPKKERGKKSLILMIISFAALFLFIGGLYFWQLQGVRNDIVSVDRQIDMTKKIIETTQNNPNNNESALSVTVLKNAVEWANSYPIQTVPVMQHLTALLPQRGFIQTFGYIEAGTVTLSVQFDSSREAAYFLDNLNESDWIDDASLSSLTAQELQETTKEVTTNTPETTQTENGQTTTNQSIIITPDPNKPGSFIITPVNASGDGTTNIDSTKVTEPTNKFVPRYIGQFEIKFKKETIKGLLNKGDGNGEGVTSS
jgi:Tfp pilus assembly protein PilN